MKTISISDEVYDQVSRLVEAQDVSVDQKVETILRTQMAGYLQLKERASRGSEVKFRAVMAKVRSEIPDQLDSI